MPIRRHGGVWLAVVLLLAAGGAVAGCQGDDKGASLSQLKRDLEPMTTVLGGASIFSLPPIPIEVDNDGRIARIGGFKSAQVDELWERITGNPLVGRVRFFSDDEDGESYTRWFARAGIRQMTVASRRDGLYVLVNGRPLPYIAWGTRELDNALDLIDRMAVDDDGDPLLSAEQRDMLADLAPLLQSVPLQLDFNFPPSKGAPRAPKPPSPDADAFIISLTDAERETLPSQTIDIDLDYERRGADRSWVPSWLGFSTDDLRTLLAPADVKSPLLRLRSDLQTRLQRASVDDAELQLTNSGLYLIVDGHAMPHVGWNEETLANLVGVLNQLYPAGEPRTRDNAWVDVLRATAPLYNDVSLGFRVHFPDSERVRAAAATATAGVDPTATPTRTRRPRPTATPRAGTNGSEGTRGQGASTVATPRRIDVDATLTAAPAPQTVATRTRRP